MVRVGKGGGKKKVEKKEEVVEEKKKNDSMMEENEKPVEVEKMETEEKQPKVTAEAGGKKKKEQAKENEKVTVEESKMEKNEKEEKKEEKKEVKKPVEGAVKNVNICKGDVVWVPYRRDPLWPALILNVYPKKFTYAFFPLAEDGQKAQPFSRAQKDVYAVNVTDQLPPGVDKKLEEAFASAKEYLKKNGKTGGSAAPPRPQNMADQGDKKKDQSVPLKQKKKDDADDVNVKEKKNDDAPPKRMRRGRAVLPTPSALAALKKMASSEQEKNKATAVDESELEEKNEEVAEKEVKKEKKDASPKRKPRGVAERRMPPKEEETENLAADLKEPENEPIPKRARTVKPQKRMEAGAEAKKSEDPKKITRRVKNTASKVVHGKKKKNE